MPSSSWNVRDNRRQVMVLSFFVNRMKSFPIRMEPLETDFSLHVTPDAQQSLKSRTHYRVFFPLCLTMRCQHLVQHTGFNSNISLLSKGFSIWTFFNVSKHLAPVTIKRSRGRAQLSRLMLCRLRWDVTITFKLMSRNVRKRMHASFHCTQNEL